MWPNCGPRSGSNSVKGPEPVPQADDETPDDEMTGHEMTGRQFRDLLAAALREQRAVTDVDVIDERTLGVQCGRSRFLHDVEAVDDTAAVAELLLTQRGPVC